LIALGVGTLGPVDAVSFTYPRLESK